VHRTLQFVFRPRLVQLNTATAIYHCDCYNLPVALYIAHVTLLKYVGQAPGRSQAAGGRAGRLRERVHPARWHLAGTGSGNRRSCKTTCTVLAIWNSSCRQRFSVQRAKCVQNAEHITVQEVVLGVCLKFLNIYIYIHTYVYIQYTQIVEAAQTHK
jgi:hypothetical protein